MATLGGLVGEASLQVKNGLLVLPNGQPALVDSSGALIPGQSFAKKKDIVPTPSTLGKVASDIPGAGIVKNAASSITSVAGAAESAAKALAATVAWLSNRDNIFRVVKVMIGGAMIIQGILIMTKPVTGVSPVSAATVAKLAA